MLLGQFHAAQRLAVEEFVILEDVFYAPALGIDLDMGVEFLAAVGNHPLDEHFLAFTKVVLLLLRQLHALDFFRDEDVLRFHRHHLVGELVNTDKGRYILTVTVFQFHHTTHVTCFQQVLLVLVREDVAEIRSVKFGFLTDAVDAQNNGATHGLLE